MSRPDLSAAIIFKNEIRCLERCLKSLQPLRERLSLQIVMADTGSDDGSRAVAERYADVLIDFPWINDFAAARNAALEKCDGRWALVIDCDEWLLEDETGQLVDFILDRGSETQDSGLVTVRNYNTGELINYGDLKAFRLLNMASKPRYEGAIHEYVVFGRELGKSRILERTILHHDGYVMLNEEAESEAGRKKIARNLALLKEEIKREPDDPRTIILYLESAGGEPDYMEQLRHGLRLAEDKVNCSNRWQKYGAQLYRYAVLDAHNMKLPEYEEWVEKAWKLFPNSYFTRLDVSFIQFVHAHDAKDMESVVRHGERYLQASADYAKDVKGQLETRFGTLQREGGSWVASITCGVAEGYYRLGQYDKALEKLKTLQWEHMGENEVRGVELLLKELYEKAGADVSELLVSLWNGIQAEKPSAEKAKERVKAFLDTGMAVFLKKEDVANGAWKMFLPLRGKCSVGNAAALLAETAPDEADRLLAAFDDLTALPAAAFVHALKLGAEFPLPDKPLPLELADVMANKLSTDAAFLREAVLFTADAFDNNADLNWARALGLAALQGNDWKTDKDPQPLLRAIVRVESAFLARCYTKQALSYPAFLPPLHRFGLHLVNAFAVLSPGAVSSEFDATAVDGVRGALAELKAAVVAAPEQKAVVEVILNELSGEIV